MTTKIEWVRNTDGSQGETWNPVSGCTKVSPGCKNCYAERMAKRLAGRYGYPEQPHQFDVTLHPGKLDLPLRWKKPRMVFVCSMGDLFHEDVPDVFIAEVWRVMYLASEHTFQVLTKRPRRMLERFSKFADEMILSNVWLGVSVENQAAADERIPWLLRTPAALRFVSCEPLLGRIDLFQCNAIESDTIGGIQGSGYREFERTLETFVRNNIDWIIIGGESGPGARPMHPDWARSLRNQCQRADVPFFFKQWGHYKEIQFDKRGKGDVLVSPTRGVIDHLPDPLEHPEEFKHTVAMSPVGKRTAGRILDNRTWDEMPGQEPQP